ncbi:hypothetical protein, partial [Xanthomonas translucens]
AALAGALTPAQAPRRGNRDTPPVPPRRPLPRLRYGPLQARSGARSQGFAARSGKLLPRLGFQFYDYI